MSLNNENIASDKIASNVKHEALMAKVDSSSESNKVEMDRPCCATLEVILAQSDEQDLRIWKLTAGATMQLQLDSCECNLLIIGMKPTWNPKATSFEIFKDSARNSLQLSEGEIAKNEAQDVDICNRANKTRKPSMLVKFYSLEHKDFIYQKSSVLAGTGMKLINSVPLAYQETYRNFEQQERDMRIKLPKNCCRTKIETCDGWMSL